MIRLLILLLLTCALAHADEARMERGWLTIRYPEGREELAEHVATLAQAGPAQLKQALDLEVGPATILLVERELELREEVGSYVPPWALAVAMSSRRLIIVRADKIDVTRNQLGPTLNHELAHLAMGNVESKVGRRLPQWFEEGVCEWVSGQAHYGAGQKLALDAALGSLFSFDELTEGFPPSAEAASLAYAQSRDFVAWIESSNPGALRSTLAHFSSGMAFDAAIRAATGVELARLEKGWRTRVTPRFPALFAASHLIEAGTVMAVLCVIAYWRRRRRDRVILAQMEENERDEYPGWYGTHED